MDKDILRDLYYGRLSPWEMTFRNDSNEFPVLRACFSMGALVNGKPLK